MDCSGAGKRTYMEVRAKAIYGNLRVLDVDGNLLFRAGEKRLEWYLSRGLADRIDSSTIQLRFANKGTGRQGSPFYLQDMDNACVVCGTTETLTIHHVVPRQYRQHMPETIKSRSSHDLLPLCVNCHDGYERYAVQFKKHLADCFCAPLDGVGWIERRDIGRGARAAAVLIRCPPGIPAEKVAQLRVAVTDVVCANAELFSPAAQQLIRSCGTGEAAICSNGLVLEELAALRSRVQGPEFRSHGEAVVDAVARPSMEGGGSRCAECRETASGGVPALVGAWRRHFISHTQPRHLPAHWSVTHPCQP
ncbi:hypothetical protein GGF46_004000 [Coemansia sp. RSA 552]|nr:hypothetical protein GGF46_004000 [Coemansia sp. RSA 552]